MGAAKVCVSTGSASNPFVEIQYVPAQPEKNSKPYHRPPENIGGGATHLWAGQRDQKKQTSDRDTSGRRADAKEIFGQKSEALTWLKVKFYGKKHHAQMCQGAGHHEIRREAQNDHDHKGS